MNRIAEHERDERLGGALRELEVPELEPGFEERLRAQLERPRARRRAWVLAPVAAAAAVLVAALVAVLSNGSEVASAAAVRDAVQNALASAGSISGVFVNNESGPAGAKGVRWEFVETSSGAFAIRGVSTGSRLVYDPKTNVELSSDGSLFVKRIGLAPGPPDAWPADFVQRGVGSVVAALAAARDPRVEEIRYAGRSAWLLRIPTGNPGETRRITVDRATGMPVHSLILRSGKFGSEWRIEGLRVSSEQTRIAPLEPTPGQAVTRYDMGFHLVSLSAARARAGYEPLVPSRLPDGYELSQVAFAKSSRPTGEEQGGNPVSHNVVSLAYRRGLDRIVVTTRLAGTADWQDPLRPSSLITQKPEQIRFGSGSLKGSTGELVLDPNSIPHVWAVTPKLVVTVAGNIGRNELLEVAESLKTP